LIAFRKKTLYAHIEGVLFRDNLSENDLHQMAKAELIGGNMKRIKIGVVEILGYIGIIIWVAIIFLREYNLSDNRVYLFFIGILPNLAAAWGTTMFAKWIVIFVCKRSITVKIHLLLCMGIIAFAFGSEIVHDLFLSSPFDVYDMIITFIAQIIMFLTPILTKDKYFSNYA